MQRILRHRVLAAAVMSIMALAAGCDTTGERGSRDAITVSAAASLAGAFIEIGNDFMTANEGVEVTFNFDSSSILATQIIEGAPADVYAAADRDNMARLVDEGLIAAEATVFARNEFVLVTKPGNPEGVAGLADLPGAGVVSLCASGAPCGRYADAILDRAGVAIPEASVTRGQNVTATLTAVAAGDAVAAIVYASDAVRAGDAVDTVSIPGSENITADYPIGVLAGADRPDIAAGFVAYVVNGHGRAVLQEFGFLPAP